MAYNVRGKGTPVLLIHGFGMDSRIWDEYKTDLVEEKYRVITVDLPGFGQSDVIEEISIREMAEAVSNVLDTLKLEKVFLIGHSMGGYVGLAFAELYPDRLLGLGLFHSHASADTLEKKAMRQKGMDFLRRQGSALYIKQLIPGLFAPSFVNSNAFLIEKLTFRASLYKPAGVIAALGAMKDRPDRSEVLRSISCPVLFIVGKLDATLSVNDTVAQAGLPAIASVHLLDKIAHMGMFEAGRQTQVIIRNFLAFCLEGQMQVTS